MGKVIKYGWLSAKAVWARRNEYRYPSIYATPAGGRLYVTDVTSTPERNPGNQWPDLVFVGEVTDCLRISTGQWCIVDGEPQGPESGVEWLV